MVHASSCRSFSNVFELKLLGKGLSRGDLRDTDSSNPNVNDSCAAKRFIPKES